ncbi:hypothetical protein DFJ63DRAFT_313386 [Scheffersomyces coipomensis]|uniref:uncharacterized protein n=1 Tax=Scheffersomyces coipomensis TaxID=1788519 RepID=UPI00315DE64B
MDDEEYQADALVRRLDIIYQDISRLIDELSNIVSNQHSIQKATAIFNRLKLLINESEPNPKLLDNQLGFYIPCLTNLFLALKVSTPLRSGICEIIYNFSKIRGFKFISNYFSSDIYIIDTLIDMIENCDGNIGDNEMFTCLLWLSNLVLIPFKLDDIDPKLMNRFYQIGLEHLKIHSNASKNQIVSSIILSRLLTRSDSTELLQSYLYEQVGLEWKSNNLDSTIRLGHLLTINKILKRTTLSNDDLMIIYDLISLDLLCLQKNINSLNNNHILFLIKILSKLSIRFGENYSQISLIINNLINDVMNLLMNKKLDMKLRYEIAKSLSEINLSLSKRALNYRNQLIIHVLDLLDVDLTNDEIEINDDKIIIPKYHTILLFLGYISLNKSLPLDFVPLILKIIHRTLFIEQRRFQTVLGNQLRDSSCFILWSICRTLTIKQFDKYRTYLEIVLFDLIKVIIFDSDLIVRKCGLAVLQEFIGRFGQHMFIHLQDPNERGEFIIKFIEIFNSFNRPLELIKPLIIIGNLNKNLFIQILLQKVCDDNNSLKLRKSLSRSLKQVIDLPKDGGIEFGINPVSYTTEQVIKSLIEEKASIYTICEIAADENDDKYSEYLEGIYNNYKFDHHHDNAERAEGYLKLVNTFSNRSSQFEFNNWDTLLEITRVNSCDIYQFQIFFENLKTDIPANVFQTILHYINNSNFILSQVIFSYDGLTIDQLDELMRIIENKRIDSDIRSNLLTNLTHNFDLIKQDNDLLVRLIDLLDDYTITNQGDVGSKIRLRALILIDQNFDRFSELFNSVELKAIRLVGELMDKIRVKAFKLVLRINSVSYIDDDFSDISSSYFATLFTFFNDNVLKCDKSDLVEQFLIGMSFTIGAMVANKAITHKSFIEFLKFLQSLDELDQDEILDIYLNNLLKQYKTSDERHLKGQVMIVNVFQRLFESNYQFPSKFKFEKLFIGCYNLHINTTNINRIQISANIFQYILQHNTSNELKIKIMNRLIWISCQHRIPKIRKIIGEEILFEINQYMNDNDVDTEIKIQEILDSIEWDHESPQNLKRHIPILQKMFLKNLQV